MFGLNFNLQGQQQQGGESQSSSDKIFSYIKNLFFFAVFIYAIYLSFKCNAGFSFGDFLAAFCCSPCYVAYRLAKGCV
jgi:hypothetical protein